jgi:hypothetical protein
MWRLSALWIACALAFGADDAWQQVKDLKAGSDIRVFKKGFAKPLEVKSGTATDDKLIITTKKEEVAIDKADIDRIDYHPARTKSSTTTTEGSGANSSWSSGTSWGRDGWKTVYQRSAGR